MRAKVCQFATFVPESGSQLYHVPFDRCAGERGESAGQERFRDVVVRSRRKETSRGKARAGTPLVPARASQPCVPPLREARYQSFMK